MTDTDRQFFLTVYVIYMHCHSLVHHLSCCSYYNQCEEVFWVSEVHQHACMSIHATLLHFEERASILSKGNRVRFMVKP